MDLIKVNDFEEQAKKVYLEVYNGNINALDAFAAFKLTEDVCKNLGGKLKSDALDEADRWTEKSFDNNDYSVTKKAGSGKFNYKDDEEWSNLNSMLKSREEDLKTAYKMSPKECVIDGEVIPVVSYTHYSSSLSIKKQ
jgi:hypothetical protein